MAALVAADPALAALAAGKSPAQVAASLQAEVERARVALAPGLEQMRAEILRSVHENPRTGGHFSVKKAAAKVRTRWSWPGVYADLQHWVATCRICQMLGCFLGFLCFMCAYLVL